MKNLFTILFILYSSISFAQWSPSGNNSSSGNLTIGNNNNNTYSYIKILGPNQPLNEGSKRDFIFHFNSAGQSIIRSYRWTSWGTYLQFLTTPQTGGEPIERLHIGHDGLIGIGTTSPKNILDLRDGFSFHDGGHKVLGFGYAPGGAGTSMLDGYVSEIRLDPTKGHLRFGISKSSYSKSQQSLEIITAMTIDSGARVGIGTSTPSQKLDVRGNIALDQYSIFSRGGSSISFGNTGIGICNEDDDIGINIVADGELEITHNSKNMISVNQDQIQLAREKNAQVIIGNFTKPDYRLAVDGSIGARSVKVEMNAWPDYVFAEDYDLKPLSEVEAHIKEHKHLPDVPSAQEVEESGVNLGESDAILLRKIEELTLYTIEQDKKIKELEAKNKEIEEIKTLYLNQQKLIEKLLNK
ncbi:hypothetical protein [Flammeovirga sp. SJP92]|uniref:hypothetical protein n=1 Tax=Flammeovirga sp. SJP92 TaxID=1775430 RepID=UPI000786D5C3|nr:hypothetical protein [Flammeovirga sp. SJP92]KXX71227.1 hypothetical protein AVL50_09225 [Flammeovirga sp. SJP92]